MSFTVTMTGSTFDATAAVVFTCSALAECIVFATPMCSAGAYVALSCDGGSFSDGAYDSLWGALPMKGNTPSFTSCSWRTSGASACSMTGSAALTKFAQTTTTTSRFKLKDKCRSEKWEVYLYGDMTIKVMGPDVQKTAEFSAVAVPGVMGRLFLGPCTQVHGQAFPPPSGRGRGGGGRRELAPRCSATQLGASRAWVWRNTHMLQYRLYHNHHNHHNHTGVQVHKRCISLVVSRAEP